ncbi:MAG: hypothetical protein WCO23_01485 [bacterium]
MAKKRNKNQQQDILFVIIAGIFKMLWWLITLPFKGIKKRNDLSVSDRAYISSKREEIERNLQSQNIFELKHALIEADKLLDYTLEKRGFAGKTVADKLKEAQQFLSQDIYNQLWQGHKTRNQAVHEHGINISENQLKEATKKLLLLRF